jgi:hypothetical protein
MKIKSATTAALIALGLISQASADNVVYLTGSTAFRSTVYNVLAGTNVFDAAPTYVSRKGSGSSASYMLFHGDINGTPTYINCVWSGSEAGIASVANVTIDNDGNPLPGSPATWLKADGSVTGNDTGAPTSGELEASSHGADLAMADTSQAVSLTPKVANTSTDLKDYGTVGIVTFVWVKNLNSSPSAEWSALTNVSIPQLNSLISAGYQPAAFFTGNAAHTNNNVYLVGRNKGSGTRANTLADTLYGTTRSVQQFSIGGGVSTPTDGTLTLAYEGNNGYESGGGVAGALKVDGSCGQTDPFFPGKPGWLAIGYLGIGDAGGTLANNWLTLDGTAESDGAIAEGRYSFWGHEHVFGKQNISGFLDTVGGKLHDGIIANLETAGAGSNPAAHSGAIAVKYMHCDKASDVAFPTRN